MSPELTQFTPNLWISHSRLYDFNSGIFYNSGHACLVDPGVFPVEIEAITSFMKMQEVSPQVIILTHSHWDHLMGLAHFPGCKVIAQANFVTEVQGEAGELIRRQVEKLESDHEVTRPRPFAIPQPDETFPERMSLQVGNIALELLHTPGHAADHLSIYLPEDGTLWAGDLLSDVEIPYIIHNLAAYEATLSTLAALEIKCLVPGHGNPTSDINEIQARLAADRTYLASLREQVAQAVADGLTAEETVEACAGFQHPCLHENAGGTHQLNVESVYMEFGGEADPTAVGWHQNFDM